MFERTRVFVHTRVYTHRLTHHYLLSRCAAVWQRDAFADKALVRAFVLVEDLLNSQAGFKHLHLFLLLKDHLQPLLRLQNLLL